MRENKGLRASIELSVQIMLEEKLARPTILLAHDTAQAVQDFRIKALAEIKNMASKLTIDDIEITEITIPCIQDMPGFEGTREDLAKIKI